MENGLQWPQRSQRSMRFSDCSSFLIDVSSKTSHLSRLQQSKYNSDTDSVFGVLPVNIMVGVSNVDN